MTRRAKSPGFTLVELVVVIAIAGIIAAVMGVFIAGPVQGFFDQARRAELVDAAQLALIRVGRDVRAALPNSVRVSGGSLELLLTLDGGRYRDGPPGGDDDRLTIGVLDDRFDTLAPLAAPDPLLTPYTFTGSLAVYPLPQAEGSPYRAASGTLGPPGTFTVNAVTVGAATEYRILMPVAHRFPLQSPTRRVFAVSGPVTYRCDSGALLRYSGYAVTDPQPVPPTGPGLEVATLARNVEACQFRYAPGAGERNAVVAVAIVLMEKGERVRLLRQIHLDNTP